MSENLGTLRYDKRFLLFIFSGDQQQNESNSLIDYFKGQFSILNDVSIDIRLDTTAKTHSLAGPYTYKSLPMRFYGAYHLCEYRKNP